MSWTIRNALCTLPPSIFIQGKRRELTNQIVSASGRERTNYESYQSVSTATLAAALALGWSPASWAGDPPSGDSAQPAAPQPAATPQPTADQRLQELEKEVSALQQEIAALKEENTPGVKTAALALPDPSASPAAFGAGGAAPA